MLTPTTSLAARLPKKTFSWPIAFGGTDSVKGKMAEPQTVERETKKRLAFQASDLGKIAPFPKFRK
jgi:hypothetical protein